MRLNNYDYFETSDISLATTLYYFGAKIEVIDKADPTRAIFHIKRDRVIDELIQRFWSHSLQVDPLTFFTSLKEVKTRLYHSN